MSPLAKLHLKPLRLFSFHILSHNHLDPGLLCPYPSSLPPPILFFLTYFMPDGTCAQHAPRLSQRTVPRCSHSNLHANKFSQFARISPAHLHILRRGARRHSGCGWSGWVDTASVTDTPAPGPGVQLVRSLAYQQLSLCCRSLPVPSWRQGGSTPPPPPGSTGSERGPAA